LEDVEQGCESFEYLETQVRVDKVEVEGDEGACSDCVSNYVSMFGVLLK